MKKIIVILFY